MIPPCQIRHWTNANLAIDEFTLSGVKKVLRNNVQLTKFLFRMDNYEGVFRTQSNIYVGFLREK